MSNLLLNSLEIRNFRGIRGLRVERLGRVNLIVGKNNAGKSTVLEALRLFASPGSLGDGLEILASRDEIPSTENYKEYDGRIVHPTPLVRLFFGRQAAPGEESSIVIGPVNSPLNSLKVAYVIRESKFRARGFGGRFAGGVQGASKASDLFFWSEEKGLAIRLGEASQFIPLEDPIVRDREPDDQELEDPAFNYRRMLDDDASVFRTLPYQLVGPIGLDHRSVGTLWDSIALTPKEQDVIDALKIISPSVFRLALKDQERRSDNAPLESRELVRIAYVALADEPEPFPLRVLGDGMNRMFGISLALVNVKDGLLLIDEIENGIHYSVQPDLWRLIFKTATRLGVQVFATTHSYDCIRAFEEAAKESEEEGVLIRLAQKAGRTLVGEFDERELGIAVEGQIEVR